jgi:hypothetical protein
MELVPEKPPTPPSYIIERFFTTVAVNHTSPISSKAGRKQAGDIFKRVNPQTGAGKFVTRTTNWIANL